MSGYQNVRDIGDYRRKPVAKTGNGDGVTTWTQAHRIAMIAAGQAHRDLDVDTSEPPIDVATAIVASGAKLMWTPLPRLFGMYMNLPGAAPGVAVNSGLPHGARRHTAAHELGHRLLGHATGTDDGNTIDAGFTQEDELPTRRRAWPDNEKIAEAFAAWFLMPRRAVVAAMGQLGLHQLSSPLDVYRVSLVLGTSYQTTLRQLPNLRLLSASQASQFGRTPPGRIKAKMDAHCQLPTSRHPDVWMITVEMAGLKLELHTGDRLVLNVPNGRLIGSPDWLIPVPPGRNVMDPLRPDVLECLPDRGLDSPSGQDRDLTETSELVGTLVISRDHPEPDLTIVVTHRPAPLGIDQRCLPSLWQDPT